MKDNFIKRGMKDLSGVIQSNLAIENRFKIREPIKLTDSGTEIVDGPDDAGVGQM